jgi:hypothetical protein
MSTYICNMVMQGQTQRENVTGDILCIIITSIAYIFHCDGFRLLSEL